MASAGFHRLLRLRLDPDVDKEGRGESVEVRRGKEEKNVGTKRGW